MSNESKINLRVKQLNALNDVRVYDYVSHDRNGSNHKAVDQQVKLSLALVNHRIKV